MNVAESYAYCEHVTAAQARNFSYGIRLLAAPKRRALSAVYAFARRIDDIGDGDLPAQEKLVGLDAAREQIRAVSAATNDPVLVALNDAARRYPIPLDAFEELIDGCAADVRGTSYATFDQLLHYCRCVAGSIGRLSLGVFEASDPRTAAPLADALGVALQLTNILRDIREDRMNGRVYLPASDLDRFGCGLEIDRRGAFVDPPDALIRLVHFESERAQHWYDNGLRLLTMLDRRSYACTATMAGIYHRLLERIATRPLDALNHRMSTPIRSKVGIALRTLAGVTP